MPSERWLRRAFVVFLTFITSVVAGCSDGASRSASTVTPTSPTSAATHVGPSAVTPTSVADRSTNGAMDVTFPPRNEPLQFRQQLEVAYRDGLRRSATTSFVDLEGTIVWTQEYLRYRVNGCNNADAVSRVQAQIEGRGVQPVCADFTGTSVQFPPRNEPFAFRQELERIYRDTLRRDATQTFVDPEGDIVWTQEYLRYRLNRCSHTEATDRVLSQVNGGPVQPTCDSAPVTPTAPITSFVTGVTADGATGTLVSNPRPNAGAGPIVSGLTQSGNAITITTSTPVDRLIVSVNTTTTSAPGRLSPMAVLNAFYEIRLPSPRTIAVVVVQIVAGTAVNFNVEIAAGLGNGPIGNYFSQPASAPIGAGLAAQPCSLEGSIRSIDSNEAASILFVNTSGQPRRVIWLNFNGERVFYRALQPGEAYSQPTFVTHPWISATANDVCQAIYLTVRGSSQVNLR